MIYLIFSIACSTAIFLLFRSFPKYGVNNFSAIVINYFIATAVGIFLAGPDFSLTYLLSVKWLGNGLLLGVIFITLFNLMAITSQKLGPSVASVANKMALAIPVVFAIFYYGESNNTLKITGVILALPGVYLASIKTKKRKKKRSLSHLWLPLVIFIGSGFIDTYVKYTEKYLLQENTPDAKLFSSLIFFTAFILGSITLIFSPKRRSFSRPSLLAGILLGVVNYGSIYFLLLTFKRSALESSVVFPINNMGVVLTTSVFGFLLFREQFSRKNLLGIFLSVIAILLIAFSRI
jgi:drug/metabolite transporter (DMT)-like permease